MGDRELLRGLEFDFVAVDSTGLLAVLSSAGYGPIPEEILERPETEEQRIEILRSLPQLGGFTAVGDRDGDLTSWTTLSERGLYCYDWKHWAGPYLAVSRPDVTLRYERAVMSGPFLRLPIAFDESESIDFAVLGVPQVL